MNYSSKNTISQQKADGPSDFLGITQSSGLDHHAVYSRQRVDDFRENAVVSTQSARQCKDGTLNKFQANFNRNICVILAVDRNRDSAERSL